MNIKNLFNRFRKSKEPELSYSLTYILDQTEEEGRRICIQNIIERNINQENQDENETI